MSRWSKFWAQQFEDHPKGRFKVQWRALSPWAAGSFLVLAMNLTSILLIGPTLIPSLLLDAIALTMLLKGLAAYNAAGDAWDAERNRRDGEPKRWN